MEIYTDNSRVIDGLVLRNKKLEERIAELEAKNKELNDIYFSCNCRPSELAIRDLEQQAKGVEDAKEFYSHKWADEFESTVVNIMKNGDGYIYPEGLEEYASQLRNQAKSPKRKDNE